MSVILAAALWSGAATAIALAVARLSRPADAALWHRVWVAIAAGSLLLPIALAWPARELVTIPLGASFAAGTEAVARPALASVATFVYGLGVAVSGVQLISGLLLVDRLRRRSVPVEGFALTWMRGLTGGIDAAVHVHARVQVPLAAGWWRPVVILPEAWLTCEPARLYAVLRHEAAHIERRDYPLNVLGAIFRAVFWFSPAAWIVTSRIRLTSELAADRAASVALGRLTYARILLESARELLHAPRTGVLAPSAAAALEARVAALTDAAPDREPVPASTRRATALLVAALLLSSTFVGFSAPSPPVAIDDHDARHAARHANH